MRILDKSELQKEIDTIYAIIINGGIAEVKIEGLGEKGRLTVVEVRRFIKTKRET